MKAKKMQCYSSFRFCAIADEMNDIIYMIGGNYQRRKARKYMVQSNSWVNMADGSLSYDARVRIRINLN